MPLSLHHFNDLIHAGFTQLCSRRFCHNPDYRLGAGLTQKDAAVISQTVSGFFHLSLNGFVILSGLLIFYPDIF